MRSGYNHSLRSQPLPVNPGGQPHSPVTWLQEVPWGQWHRWAHRFPYEPGKQTERAQMSYSTLDLPAGGKRNGHWGKLLFSQCNPLQPAGQMQAPVMWWHGALWSHLHCCLHPGPYKPWAHADQNTQNGNKCMLCLSKTDILPYGQFLKHYDDFWGTMIFFYLSHSLSPSSLLDRSTCHSLDHTRRHSHTHTCVDSRCQSVPEHILNTKYINRMF